ncbi:MAG: putative sulfate exporter family transporter, partial [Mailhella sp.]|nr:putative sulfate exporter family transporter [Mailhella sp.]
MAEEKNVVVDDGRAKWSDLWLKEDYWAIWVGFFILICASLIMYNGREEIASKIAKQNAIIAAEKAKPIKTIELIQAQAAKKKVAGNTLPTAKAIIKYLDKPAKWDFSNPAATFVSHVNEKAKPAADDAKKAAGAALESAKAAQAAAAAVEFKDADLNKAAEAAIAAWQKADKAAADANKKVGSEKNVIPGLCVLGIGLGVLTGIGMAVMGFNFVSYFIGFLGVFVLTIVASVCGSFKPTAAYGVNAEIMSIVIGMLISNTIGTPKWMKTAVQVEYYIKAGLVLLGAEVLFNKILAIGIPGIFVAWVVTPIVLVSTYIFGQKVLKMPS